MVRGDPQNKELLGYTWSPTASMRTLKYLLEDAAIGPLARNHGNLQKHSQYFGKALKLLKSMYGMTNSGNLFADELTEWLI